MIDAPPAPERIRELEHLARKYLGEVIQPMPNSPSSFGEAYTSLGRGLTRTLADLAGLDGYCACGRVDEAPTLVVLHPDRVHVVRSVDRVFDVASNAADPGNIEAESWRRLDSWTTRTVEKVDDWSGETSLSIVEIHTPDHVLAFKAPRAVHEAEALRRAVVVE
jgi:hypothetical protein